MHFVICCECDRLHFTARSAWSKTERLAKGIRPERLHQPPLAIPRARLPPLCPEVCFLRAASLYLHCQAHLATRGNSCLQDKGSTVQQSRCSPGMGEGTQAFYSYLHCILQSTGCLYRDLNLTHFLHSTKEKFHSLAGSCLEVSGFKRAQGSVTQMERSRKPVSP